MAYRTSIGLDVHAKSVAAAAFVPETGEVVQKSFPYNPWVVAEWAKSMPQPTRCVYESGPIGPTCSESSRRLTQSAAWAPCRR